MDLTSRRFIQCDVFSTQPTKGNGLAVIVDGDGLTDAQMQDFAAWTNLAETTFICKPTVADADYALRIFTPGRELPFAGHPTLGSCMAWLHTGGMPATEGIVRQECAIGVVEIDITGAAPAFVAPPTEIIPMPATDLSRYAQALDLQPAQVVQAVQLDNGPLWQLLELHSAAEVLAIDARRVAWPDFVALAVMGPYPEGSPADFEVRILSPSSGMVEDPITGSLNAAIAQWMLAEGRLTRDLTMSQGTQLGRMGRVYLQKRDAQVLVGGHVNILIEGTVTL